MLHGDCIFLPMWEKIRLAIADIYDNTTFQDLVDADRERVSKRVLQYSI